MTWFSIAIELYMLCDLSTSDTSDSIWAVDDDLVCYHFFFHGKSHFNWMTFSWPSLFRRLLTFKNVSRVEWNETGIDTDNEKHEQYLNEFRRTVSVMIRNAIDLSLSNDPDGGKQRKKTVQVCKINALTATEKYVCSF